MYAEELLIHHGRQRQVAERVHASIVDRFRVLVFAFQLEGEVVGEMPTFMVASEQKQGVGVPYLECPEIQHALKIMDAYGSDGRQEHG